ncbi:MAG: S8 family serine peptidase [Fimbriimonas ginsengisoli]|uniref:S8 family serine peptidase n=1 Tax=Fimbriimonas ginsengisoli TaxID=1005039 RepID=A0A931PTL1_FIMGI|nr:S8 family serine peptidase [Fimbriimonas ginsengisoli]
MSLRSRCLSTLKYLATLVAPVLMLAATAPAQEPEFVPGRLLVKFREGVNDVAAVHTIHAHGAFWASTIDGIGVKILALPDGADPRAEAVAFRNEKNVDFAEPDYVFQVAQTTVTPNDPWYANWQSDLKIINCPSAWTLTTGSSSIIVAILDTGIDSTHPDLASKVVPGWNVVANNSNTNDTLNHGTAVAGVVGALSNNGIGVASVAWQCPVMPIMIDDGTGHTSASSVASGLSWASNHGARVANISYMLSPSSTVDSAASSFRSKGGVVVTSAGNTGANTTYQADPYLITVSATSINTLYSWSSFGNNVDLSAPGDSESTVPGGGYSSFAGTSCAAPHVAGVAALVLSINPALSSANVESILETTATDLGATGWDMYFGWGRVDAYAAVLKAAGTVSTDTTPPTVSLDQPAAGSTVSGTISVSATANDNNSVASVTFFVDGAQSAQMVAPPYSFSWNTTAVADGSHTLMVTAKDGAGNSASASSTVNVSNKSVTPPTCSLTDPTSGATVIGSITMSASASSSAGIASVSFTVDGVQVGVATVSPYACPWDSTKSSNGNHSVSAIAKDSLGNQSTASATVSVSNPDLTPPTVSLSNPLSGSTVSGTISLSASASDNVGVASVAFSVDGVQVGVATASPYSVTWNSTVVANGSHTISVVATDAAGNSATASVTVTVSNPVPDTIAPSITITSPVSGSTIGKTLKVYVNATDNVGVVRVEMYLDGALVATSTSSPFTTSYSPRKLASGSHTLFCRAYDAAGNVGTSASISVIK